MNNNLTTEQLRTLLVFGIIIAVLCIFLFGSFDGFMNSVAADWHWVLGNIDANLRYLGFK
jgi:hypothetical protein